MGRNTVYSPEKHRLMIDALHTGATVREAVAYAGVEWQTWCKWRSRVLSGDKFNAGVVALVGEYEQAAARGTAALLAQIKQHAAEDFRAAAFLITRRDEMPERRLRRDKVRAEIALKRKEIELAELKIAAGGVERHEVAVVSPELAAAAAREVFGSPSALETNGPARNTSAAAVEVDALPVSGPVDHRAK